MLDAIGILKCSFGHWVTGVTSSIATSFLKGSGPKDNLTSQPSIPGTGVLERLISAGNPDSITADPLGGPRVAGRNFNHGSLIKCPLNEYLLRAALIIEAPSQTRGDAAS